MIIDSTTISGLVAGGLPDASVTTADIADGAITPAKLSGSQTGSAPVYGCRAWCIFDGTLTGTNVPTASGNITSVTRNGTGDYTINFTVAMIDTNYCVQITGGISGVRQNTWGMVASNLSAPTTTAVRIKTYDDVSSFVDETRVSIAVFR